jgi:cell fate (sporulation/competence/biofilm development) regulator YmcA (YheA/YmcA/DUF963 family)
LVANTDHEPKGGKQGIKRAKREGKNPKTYGQNFAARGFVPNFFNFSLPNTPAGNIPAAAQAAAASKEAAEATKKVTQALNGLNDATENTNKLEDDKTKSMQGAIGVAFAFSMVMSTALPYIQQFAQTIKLDEEALKIETEARNKAVKSLEEEKNKGAKASAESIKSIEAEILKRDESIAAIEEEAANFAASVAGIVGGVINFGSTLAIVIPSILSALTAVKAAGGVSAALDAAGVSKGFQKAGAAAAAAGVAMFLLEKAIDYITKRDVQKLDNVTAEYKVDITQLNMGRLSTNIAKIQLVIDALAAASDAGYQTIKLAAEGMRSEFQRLNDEVGISGASSKITQAEGLDKIISGAKDFVAQENIRKTKDPLEQQRIVKQRQEEKAGPEADRQLQRARARAAGQMKTSQEDLFTALEPYLNQGTATSATANDAMSAGGVPQGVFSKDNAYAPPPSEPTGPRFSINEPELSVNETDFDPSPAGVAMRAARQKVVDDEIKRRERDFESGNAVRPPDYVNSDQEERFAKTSKGEAGILGKDLKESANFAKTVQAELAQSSQESQSKILEQIKAYQEASVNIKNAGGGLAQGVALKDFSDTSGALEALFVERAESSGGDVGAIKEAFEASRAGFAEGVKAQTDAFVQDREARKQIELDSLQQQKQILDQFIENFNTSFLQNAEKGADLFAQALSPGAAGRGQENIEALKGQKLGQGMADAATYQKRQEGLISTINRLDSAKFFDNFGDSNKEGDFKTRFNIERLGGVDGQILQKGLDLQSRNLQQEVSAQNADGSTNLVAQRLNSDQGARNVVASATQAFAPVLEQIKTQATEAGDTNLVATIDKKLAVLNNDRATVPEKIAAGSVNLEGTRLSPEAQEEFQIQLIEAGQAVKASIDSLKGSTVAAESDSLGKQIESLVPALEGERKPLDTTAEAVELATIVSKLTESSDGFNGIIENLKEGATGFKKELDSLKEGIANLVKDLSKVTDPVKKTTMKTDLENLSKAAKAAEDALRSIKPAGDSGEGGGNPAPQL